MLLRREPIIEETHVTLSALLMRLSEHGPQPISIEQILEHFGHRAFGAALFIFAVPNLLPLPPGSSTVLGLPLLFIAPQLALGGQDPWIPGRVRRRTIDPAVLGAVCRKVAPWVERAEAVTTRRLGFMFGGLGDVLLGLVCTLLAAVLILPIPLGNLLPAAAIAILALALIQRDGLLAIAGYVVAAVSGGVLVLSGHLAAGAAARAVSWAQAWA